MRTSREDWAKRVERWQESGLTAEQFASELGINAGTLKFWKYKLGRPKGGQSAGKGATAAKPTPQERLALPLVEVRSAPVPASVTLFELELGGGRRLRIPTSFEAEALERLLVVLGRTP